MSANKRPTTISRNPKPWRSKDLTSIERNPFNVDSTEYDIYDDIIKLINQCIQKKEWLNDDFTMFHEVKSPRRLASSAFVKMLINEYNFNFSVSEYEYYLFTLLPSPKGHDKYERFKEFFKQSISALEKFHYWYLKWLDIDNTITIHDNVESIKKILLNDAYNYKSESIDLKSLRIQINDRLLNIPREMTNNEMFEDFKSHLPKTVIKTKTTTKREFKVGESSNVDFNYVSPWTSSRKATEYMTRNKWKQEERQHWNAQQLADSFNYKQQSKAYMLKTVAPRYSFIIDYFFPGKFIYLLAININTRKAYAIPTSTIKEINKNRFVINEKGNKTATQSVELLKTLIKKAKNVKHILCDQENAFMSVMFKKECRSRKIELKYYIKNDVKGVVETKESSRGVHSALALIDRLCRTIRRMNYNIGNGPDIDPKTMEYLINEYNNSPHTTLSSIVGKPITPNIVNDNPKIEDFIVETIAKENIMVKLRDDYNIVGRWCRCLNESGKFDKVKHKLLPGIWKVVGTENGLFKCQKYKFVNHKALPEEFIIKLPRYMIKLL